MLPATMYEIRLLGLIEPRRFSAFSHLSITHEGDETVLYGRFPDQAALFGLLSWLRDLGAPLLLVQRHTTK